MKAASHVIRVLITGILLAVTGPLGWSTSAGDVAQAKTLAFTISGGGAVGEGDEFATRVIGDPWDMSEQSDILPWNDLPGANISGGVLSYILPSSFPGLPLLFPAGSQIDAGKIGALYPIDADRYHWLSFRLKQSAGTSIAIRWHYARSWEPFAETVSIPVTTSDWQTYVIDLETYPRGAVFGGRSDWSGQIMGLYIGSPNSTGQMSLDWARLTADNPSANNLSISWSGAGAPINFYLDTDTTGCNGALIHTESGASANGSFAWGNSTTDQASPANFAPGVYYVCAKSGGATAYSSTPVTINQSPVMRFTRPSYTSGPDYATAAGNPWDMSDAADIDHVAHGAASFTNGLLAVSVRSDQTDQQVHLALPNNLSIDSSLYYYLTYKVMYDYPTKYNIDAGQFGRIYWASPQEQSKLIYLFPNWQVYSFDLRSLPIDWGPQWSTENWTSLRLDPIANKGHTVNFYIDYVKLTGNERVDKFADVEWQMSDPDTPVTTMKLYYDTDQAGLNGALLATLTLTNGLHSAPAVRPAVNADLSIRQTTTLTPTVYLPVIMSNYHPPCSGACYTWSTKAVTAGTYYLYACLDDGYNHQVCRYSETPLVINH